MSYEGYVQVLCEDGHLNEHPYDYSGDGTDGGYGKNFLCSTDGCMRAQVFWNHVNETNGPDDSEKYCPGHMEFEIVKERVFEKCNLGHMHLISEDTYKIPDEQTSPKR